jgi:hypothetical protein
MGAATSPGIACRLIRLPPTRDRAVSDKVKEMIQPRAKTMTLVRWQCRRGPTHRINATESAQYLIIVMLLCALSAVSALKDPLNFAAMFTNT